MARPLIAVTGRALALGRIPGWLEPAVALPSYYSESLHRAGGTGVIVAPQADPLGAPEELIARVDGLVLTGGVDLDPATYGEEPHPATVGWESATDAWEAALLAAAVARDLPVLAICRGHQLLNVARGGTLEQHLPDRLDERSHGIPNGGGGTRNEVRLLEGSRAATAFGTTVVTGNCHHHQAVGRLGEGLSATGRTSDGVIEVIEADDARWIVGVQWHPEDTTREDPVQQRLFEHFVSVAAR